MIAIFFVIAITPVKYYEYQYASPELFLKVALEMIRDKKI